MHFCFHNSYNFCSQLTSAISLHAQVQFHAKYPLFNSQSDCQFSLPLAMCFYRWINAAFCLEYNSNFYVHCRLILWNEVYVYAMSSQLGKVIATLITLLRREPSLYLGFSIITISLNYVKLIYTWKTKCRVVISQLIMVDIFMDISIINVWEGYP